MAYQKLQVSRALQVIKSDNASIPYPSVVKAGTNVNVIANELEDTTANFVAVNVAVGDVVFANVLGGTFLPVQVLKVFASGTAASNIVALW